jgi:DNA-binding transcriptional regulator YiaG
VVDMEVPMGVLEEALARAEKLRTMPAPGMRRRIRERAGLTQLDLAAALGVSRPAVSRWEAGQREPRGELGLRYVEILDRLSREAA